MSMDDSYDYQEPQTLSYRLCKGCAQAIKLKDTQPYYHPIALNLLKQLQARPNGPLYVDNSEMRN